MREVWERERAALGFAASDAPTPAPQEWIEAPAPADLPPRRYTRRVRGAHVRPTTS